MFRKTLLVLFAMTMVGSTAKTDEESLELLKQFGFPFRDK